LVPVPLHIRRERWRGFNQSQLIAEKLSDKFGIEIDCHGLKRVKHGKAQAKLSKSERWENIKGSFFWEKESLSGRNIILIDDVVTTGATLNEAAKVLKENGAGEVWGLVVARG